MISLAIANYHSAYAFLM